MQPQRARIWLCGPLRVELDERRVESLLPARQGRLVFAYLLLRRRRPVSRDELVDALWPQRPPADPQAALNTLVARLRAALGPGTITGRSELSLALGPDPWIDVEAAEGAVAASRARLDAGRAADALSCAEEALAIVEQPLLGGLDRPWLDERRRELEALRPALLAVVGHAGLALGGSALARGTDAAWELAALEPFRESARELLMRLLASAGDIAEAVRVYEDLRIHLRDELGTLPSPRLAALHERLLTAPDEVVAAAAARAPSPSSRPAPLAHQGEAPLARAQRPQELPRPLQPAVGQLPFTGRDQQLAYLTSRWEDVDVGAGRVVVISGEAGIGKTRAAAELAARVHEEGCLVLYGRCDEGLAVPYQPFVEALRSLLPMVDAEDVRGHLGGLAPELGRLLPELSGFGAPAAADAESARFALFEAVVALLEVMTAQRRTLLVIDDLQWAAPATLLLLRHVIRSQRPLALLLIITFRSTELGADEPLAQLLADLQRDDSAHRMALGGLDERAIDALLRAAVGPALADRAARLGASVHAETAGNPFFVRELVAHLMESDALTHVGDGPASTRLPAKLDIPEGLRSVVCHRVARLSKSARQLVTNASVAGAAIDVSLLDSLLPHNGGLLDAVDEVVAAGLLVEGERGEFDFAHALVRQTLYEDLSTARRLRLHRQLGEALEARGDTHQHVDALAHHFAQLALEGETDKAIAYAIAAGHAATARLAYEDAAAHFQRGLDVLAKIHDPDARHHIELLLGLGRSCWSIGDSDKARHAFRQAADIADSIGDAAAAADAALGFSGPLFVEVGAAATRSSEVLLERALAMLDERDGALRARLMGRLAAARAYAGGQHDHRALARDAVAMARRAQDKHALADVLATCYWATRGPDDPDRYLQMAHELTGLAEEVGDVRLVAYGRGWRIGHLLERGDIDGALRELGELERLAQTRNDRFARWALAAIRAMLAYIDGQLQRAESFALEALQQWADRQFPPAAQTFGSQMILLRREQGRLDEVVEVMAAAVRQTPEIPARRCALAHIYAHLGEHALATRELELLGDLSNLPRDASWLLSVTLVATTAPLLDDHDRSRHAYELLLPHAGTCLVAMSVLCEGSLSRPLGTLATTLGRHDEAELHFRRALEMNATIRSPLWTAHTQAEYARMLGLRAGSGDRDRARALLAAANATAGELGLHALSTSIARSS